MFLRIFLLFFVTLVSIRAQQIDRPKIYTDLDNDLTSSASELIADLSAAESGKAVVVKAGKEDVIAKKGLIKAGKAKKKFLGVGAKKLDKKYGKAIGKKYIKKIIKKDKKLAAFDAAGKGFKKFDKKKGFKKIAGQGYKKKFFNSKSFGEKKAFKFGKVGAFKAEKGVAAGAGKKKGVIAKLKLKAFNKKLKGGKKEILKLKLAKKGKKFVDSKKAGLKKEGKKILKKKIGKAKILKKKG